MQDRPSSGALARRFAAFRAERHSETYLLVGICLVGLLILTIHLSTWGREARRDAKLLRPTMCWIVDRGVRSRVDEDGNVRFRPEVRIRYEVDEVTYEVWTYDRSTQTKDRGFDYAREDAERLIEPFARGGRYPCWYRDDDPSRAILVKKSTFWGWLFLFIPVSLTLFGSIWLFALYYERSRSKEARASAKRSAAKYPNVPNFKDEKGAELSRRLKVDAKSSTSFSAAIFGTCAWNLAAWSAAVYVFVKADSRADFWSAVVFSIVFCGIGLLFICRLWGRYRIERTVGSVALEVSESPITPGRTVRCRLFLKGRIAVKRLDVYVKCEEIARFVQGTNSITHRREVYSRLLFTKFGLEAPSKTEKRENFSFSLPIGVAPSFEAEHNEIFWKLVARMEFADGGTFSRDFGVVVRPFLGKY